MRRLAKIIGMDGILAARKYLLNQGFTAKDANALLLQLMRLGDV